MRPTLVFVHGMWSRPWVWDGWRQRFAAKGYDTLVVTLPGHESDAPDSALHGLGLSEYTASVLRDIAHLDRPVLLGHSLGGLITQQVAAQVPLRAAVLVNGAAPAPIFPLRPSMLPGLIRHFARPNLWATAFRLSRFEADYLLLNALPEAERPYYYERLIAESGRLAWQIGYGALNLAGNNRAAKESITCPLLSLAGTEDRIVPIGVSRRLAKHYGPRMHYREYPQHAHWLLAESGWETRVDEVAGWLDAVL